MNVALIAAGCLAVLGAAIHGVAGEILVVRKLAPETLPASPFGGPRTTRAMIHVTWHMTTIAFLVIATGLLLSGAFLDGEAARGIAALAASACTAFAALVLGLGATTTRSPRMLVRHPAPALLTATAALAWWGALGV